MSIHLVDLIMYFILLVLLWHLIDKLSNSEYTEELGVLIGLVIVLIYTAIYIVIFAYFDNNWVDLFSGFVFDIDMKLVW